MRGQPKRRKYVAVRTRQILADNVSARMEARYKNDSDKVKALAEDAGVSRSTVQRAINTKSANGATVDTITQIAMALRCEPFELLVPPVPTKTRTND